MGTGEIVVLTIVVILLVLTHAMLNLAFARSVPSAYMDEPFHEVQTRHYIAGRFDVWDHKITTPPGLYIVGSSVAWIMTNIRLHMLKCSPLHDSEILSWLRNVSAAFNIVSFCIVYCAYRRLTKLSPRQALLQALAFLTYPIVFFFGFLYYTDAGSLCCVLAAYLLARCNKHNSAALAGTASLLFRQTNVIWVAYLLGSSCVTGLHEQAIAILKKLDANADLGRASGSSAETLKIASRHNFASAAPSQSARGTESRKCAGSSVLINLAAQDVSGSIPDTQLLLAFLKYFISSIFNLVPLYPYLLPVVSFLTFLVWNEGHVVLGHHEHHQPVLHVAQLAYFTLLAAHVHHPLVVFDRAQWSALFTWLRHSPARLLAVLLLACLVDQSTLAHPFLLSDNRHYTFYIWQRFFRRVPHPNLIIFPATAICAHYLLTHLRSRLHSTLATSILTLAIMLVLTPVHLIEPRYFTVPLSILQLELGRQSAWSLAITIPVFVAVNAVTIWIFLYRPYTWVDGSVARFMW